MFVYSSHVQYRLVHSASFDDLLKWNVNIWIMIDLGAFVRVVRIL